MGNSYFQVLIPIVGLFTNALSQVMIVRYIRKLGLFKSLVTGFFIGLCATTYLELIILDHTTFAVLLTNYIIYICLGYCYFHFVNLGETGRRIRLLSDLYDSPDGLTEDEMLKRYNAEIIVNARLGRLLNRSQIVLRDERYYMGNSTILFISKIIVLIKIITLGKKSEFD